MENTIENALVGVMFKQPMTTSLKVAEYFGKRHNDVIRAIKASIQPLRNFEHSERAFIKTTYQDETGKQNPMYLLNRDGFSFVVMGFTGKKAAEFKWTYIQEFNRMEHELQTIRLNQQNQEWLETRKDVKLLYRKMTDSLKVLVDYATAAGSSNADKLYMTYNKLINRNLGIKPGQRDSLTIWQLHEIEKMQSMIETIVKGLIAKGVEYHEIYQQTKKTIESYSALAYFNGTHAALRSA